MTDSAPATANLGTGSDARASGENQPGLSKAVIKNVDMSDELQKDTIDVAVEASKKFTVEKDIAAQIKRDMDKKFSPTWHVVVGKNFGSFVTHGQFLLSRMYANAF